jgi:hypothetical protein
MRIFVFGSSITSSYWNGAATYYRGIYRQISRLGHHVTFAEPDAYGRQQKTDHGDFSYVRSIVYRNERELDSLLRSACDNDLVIKHSGVGVFDELLEERVLHCRTGMTRVAFWDVDAPATLARVESNHEDPFWRHIPEYDFIFTYGGGPTVITICVWAPPIAFLFTTHWIQIFIILWHPLPRSHVICCLLEIVCRIVKSGLRISSSVLRNSLPICSSSLAVKAGAASQCRRMSVGSGMLGPMITIA